MRILPIAAVLLGLAAGNPSGILGADSTQTNNSIRSVLLPTRSPLVNFRLLFEFGSAYEPEGKEGVAALTAAMLSQGGSRELAYEKIVEAMYPLATSFGAQVDKEMTVFVGATHVDNLDTYYGLIRQMLLEPGFREEDFTRLKTLALNYLRVSLRQNNDEELGKEQLYNWIYAGHPYGHHNLGRISTLEKLTLDDVREFYRRHYSRNRLVIGLAGGYPTNFPDRVRADFARLPADAEGTPRRKFSSPSLDPGMRVQIIQRETRSTAISMGFPIDVRRGHDDWPALALATSFLGQHRSQNSHLFQRLREARGLNYGDYAYIEYFPGGMFLFEPPPNLARQSQIFQIWIRPVEPHHGHFALRAALYEFEKLVKEGLTREQFESTREFLLKYVNILTQTQDDQLGYALDSRFYGIPEFDRYFREGLSQLTVEKVNEAIRKHFSTDSMRIVMVTKDAGSLREALVQDKPSPITYNAPKPKEILEEDKLIEKHPLKLAPDSVQIIPVTEVFE